MDPATVLAFLEPYEPSPTVWVVCAGALGCFLLGAWRLRRRGQRAGRVAVVAFPLGVALMYVALQTRFDYDAQHLFFLHRLQHLILHHLAPFLIAWSAPQVIFAAAFPEWRQVRRWPGVGGAGRFYHVIQQPAVAGGLFVGLIWVWLMPDLHIAAMLNVPLYHLMNWGMAVDGLLFWWMIFNMTDSRASVASHIGVRLLVLGLIMFPQILIGSAIALSQRDLYPTYALCGRLLPLDAMTDQQLGGLLTWIPAAMMSVVGALILVRRWLNSSAETAAGSRADRRPHAEVRVMRPRSSWGRRGGLMSAARGRCSGSGERLQRTDASLEFDPDQGTDAGLGVRTHRWSGARRHGR